MDDIIHKRKKIGMKYSVVLAAAVLSSACISPQEMTKKMDDTSLRPKIINICTAEGDESELEMKRLNYFENSWHINGSCEMGLDKVSTAMAVFYYMWKEEFGDPEGKVLNSLNAITIKWGEKEKVMPFAYSVNGDKLENIPTTGLAMAKNYIWVKRNRRSFIYNTSFVHELVHTSLWAAVGSPDADHESTIYKGENYWTPQHTEFIIEVNRMLWSLNI